jgi:CBS domain containing-hemolysin-like protein
MFESPAVGLIVAGVLVLANAFFVASEFAIVKIRQTRLEQLVSEGNGRAKTALSIAKRLDAYLSANQLGITLASLALGWVGEPAFAHVIEPMLEAVVGSAAATAAAHTISVAFSFTIITFLQTVFGELAPKSLAKQLTEPLALWTAGPLRAFYVVMFPLIWVLNQASNVVLRLLGLKPASEAELVHSPEELRLVLQHVPLEAGPRRLMDRIFDYSHRIARHVMTLRRDVVCVTSGQPIAEVLRIIQQAQYTRYPVLDADGNRVVGYLHIKDIVNAVISGRETSITDLMRTPIFASEDTPLDLLRREFQRRRTLIAIIQGPDKSFTGVVTMEDLLEEFVGEIQDEQDVGELPPLVQSPDGRFEADGRITLDVVERELTLRLPDVPTSVETLGGYLVSQFARTPRPGDSVNAGGYRLTVTEVKDRRVHRLRGEPLVEPGPDESSPARR